MSCMCAACVVSCNVGKDQHSYQRTPDRDLK
jgi:hypothetical protein